MVFIILAVLDYYSAVKYVATHAADLGVDPDRIAMAGESGGGYMVAGTMVNLAMEEEAHLVKLAIPIIAMLEDYEFTSRLSMTRYKGWWSWTCSYADQGGGGWGGDDAEDVGHHSGAREPGGPEERPPDVPGQGVHGAAGQDAAHRSLGVGVRPVHHPNHQVGLDC